MPFGGAIKLTGETEYRAALRNIKNGLTELNSELKKVSSEFSKGDNSINQYTNKNEVLNKKLKEQKAA